MKRNTIVILLSFLLQLLVSQCYSQSKMTPKEAFLYSLGTNKIDPRSSVSTIPSSFGYTSETLYWFDLYGGSLDKENYINSINDEFKKEPYIKKIVGEINTGINKVDYNKTFYIEGSMTFDTYNSLFEGFRLNEKEFYFSKDLLEIREVGTKHRNGYQEPFYILGIRKFINFDDFLYLIEMKSSEAEKFVDSRKINGVINRTLGVRLVYNVTKKMTGYHKVDAYIQKIEIFDNSKVIQTLRPIHDYFDKVALIKLKNGSDTIYFESNGSTTKLKSLAASYRVINYVNGKIINPVKVYYTSGKFFTEGRYAENSDDFEYNGQMIWYYENGQKLLEATYVEGQLNGPYRSWYSNGKKKEETNYINNVKDGCDYCWDVNGKCVVGLESAFLIYHTDYAYYYTMGKSNAFTKNCPCSTLKEEDVKQSNINSTTAKKAPIEKVDYIDHYNDDLPYDNYKIFDNTVYYKSNGLEIISVSVEDKSGNVIRNAKSKVGYPIFLKLTISGLSNKGGSTKFTLSKYEEDTNGTLVSTQSLKQDGSTNPTISIAGGVRLLPNDNEDFMKVHMSFSIKDRNSESIIHGFFTYTAER